MEFGTAPEPQSSPDIDEATRMAASSRLRVLQPEHSEVAPDDLSDTQVVTMHMVQPAVANVANDTEFTAGDGADNIAAQAAHHIALMIIVSVILIVVALLVAAYVMFM